MQRPMERAGYVLLQYPCRRRHQYKALKELRAAIGVRNHIGAGQAMCHDSRGLANHLFDEVANQISEGLSRVINRRAIRHTEPQQIDDIDVEVLRKHINVLAPLERRSAWAKTMNEHQWLRLLVALDLVEHITVLPGKAALLTRQHRVEFARLRL